MWLVGHSPSHRTAGLHGAKCPHIQISQNLCKWCVTCSNCVHPVSGCITHLHSSQPGLFSPPSAAVFPLPLGTVHVTDLDGDRVTYSLSHNFTIFTVSPAGGQVAALEEVTQTYTLTVVGVDGGTPPQTGSALILILSEGVYMAL